jgi:hypothetical protein
LNEKEAEAIINEVSKVVTQWRDVATSLQISREEQEAMSGAFMREEINNRYEIF